MKYVTHLSHRILFPVLEQLYEFHEKALNYHKEETTKNGWLEKSTDRQLSRTQYKHIQNPVKHLGWSLLQTWLNLFAKISILGANYLVDNISQGRNMKSLNRDDETSSPMLIDNNNRITIIGQYFIKVNRAEFLARFEQTELKFSLHVNEFKIIMQPIIKASLNWKW